MSFHLCRSKATRWTTVSRSRRNSGNASAGSCRYPCICTSERQHARSERNLADVRRGEFEGLRTELGVNTERAPDFGPPRVHPTAGATAIGARPFLVAYNVYLGGAENLKVAKEVAKAVRASSGGLPGVKGLGLEVDGQAQVSMNLVDTETTPLHEAYNAVKKEAAARGVETTWSEIVGLVPERVIFDAAAHHVQLRGFNTDMVLDHQVRRAAPKAETLNEFVASVASNNPVPGGGSVAAHVGALAAALAHMVAGLTVGRKKYVSVDMRMREIAGTASALQAELATLVQRDADAYATVSAAYKLPQDTDENKGARTDAIERALVGASNTPLETAQLCADVAALAAECARDGNTNAVSDAGVAALLASAAAKGAAYNVRINAKSMTNRAVADGLVAEANAAVERATANTRATLEIVERAL